MSTILLDNPTDFYICHNYNKDSILLSFFTPDDRIFISKKDLVFFQCDYLQRHSVNILSSVLEMFNGENTLLNDYYFKKLLVNNNLINFSLPFNNNSKMDFFVNLTFDSHYIIYGSRKESFKIIINSSELTLIIEQMLNLK